MAGREGFDADEAQLAEEVSRQARAVFATLAEAVSTEEWLDVIVELPHDTVASSRLPLPDTGGARVT